MSRLIGDRLPAPIRFELGQGAVAGAPGRCILLATSDASGAVRVSVLATTEVEPQDDRRIRLRVHPPAATLDNLRQRAHATLWYVLDAAAYTIQGRAVAEEPVPEDAVVFTIEIDAVLQDFREDAPMVAGPSYRPASDGS